MTYLHNDPKAFVQEAVAGMVVAYPDRLLAVPGGVIRATKVQPGEVALVIGGGSGHYPAFAGLVGPGLAHAAVLGNVFASPSAQQVYSVAKAAQTGGGVLLSYGNYAGDCLNFDQAQERLIAEGIDCRTVTVTDDITSAGPSELSKRRGIAGDLCVFKAAAWAAEQGWSLAEVWAFANKANARTRSFGVAFTGCTLPGADSPLFSVPAGMMGVGMGIHGEPGLREEPLPDANGVARLLVNGLLAEVPDDVGEAAGSKVAVLTNGLGSVKYEELFVMHGAVDALLRQAGLEIVQADVGELCTSFEMAGTSLTLCWLDEELEAAWRAPADTPGYRKGSVQPQVLRDGQGLAAVVEHHVGAGSEVSRAAAVKAERILRGISAAVDAMEAELGVLDAIAGDGDHGIGMQRGALAASQAASVALAAAAGCGTVLTEAGEAWADKGGGTSGALWGLLLRTMGQSIGDQAAVDGDGLADAVSAACQAVQDFGHAQVGDKTMVDSLVPFATEFANRIGEGDGIGQAWHQAAVAAEAAAVATEQLLPRLGRARPHAEKSLGSPDPGAVSLAKIAAAVDAMLGEATAK